MKLRLQSPRLVFTDGAEQDLTLNPGLNRFDVKVDVRTSGQFVMQADLLAPDYPAGLVEVARRIPTVSWPPRASASDPGRSAASG